MGTHQIFKCHYTLINIIERCDQSALRLLLQPICKSLRNEVVLREIVKRLKLSREESTRAYKMKWKYVGSVHTLNFRHTYMRDVSMLGNVHTLNLEECQRVKDVSKLGNVHTLNLRKCWFVKDVSKLGKVHTLNLSCTNARDVSMLNNVYKLTLPFTADSLDELRDVNILSYCCCTRKKLEDGTYKYMKRGWVSDSHFNNCVLNAFNGTLDDVCERS